MLLRALSINLHYTQMGNEDDIAAAAIHDNGGNPLTSITVTSDIEAAKSLTMQSTTAKVVKQYDTAAGLPSFHLKVCAVQNNPQWILR
jgi:hypothetical protein